MKRSSLSYAGLAGLAVVLAVNLWAQTPTPQPVTDGPMAWQHLALEHEGGSVTGDRALGSRINELGRDGWELVTVETIEDAGTTIRTVFFFKKPL